MKNFIFILLFSFTAASVQSQDKSQSIVLGGYLTSLQSVMFDSLSGEFINDNLIHNRLNFKAYLNNNITIAAEFRNRLFTGDQVRSGSSYPENTGIDPGCIDLSWNVINEKSFFLNTTIDRLWADFNLGRFQARIGRQRINWGQTLVWNPNDIFNAYSFFDFDYIERPGSDALRLQYYPAFSSVMELAIKADSENDITLAGLYRFNKAGFDIQFLAGYVKSEDLVLGTGWSGSFGSVSFRGEASWFQPSANFSDTSGTGLVTIGFDRALKDNAMVQIQLMYCNKPLDFSSFDALYSGNLSTKDLAFSKFSAFGQFTYPLTPLFNLGVSGMWFPDLNGYFAGPSIDYSIAENLDFSVIWQHFSSEPGQQLMRINLAFIRIKYSF